MKKRIVITAMCAWMGASGQTLLDLRTQARDVDFSGQSFTRPVKVGAGLPATCGLGDLYFRSDATPGGNLYGCTATNTWTQVSSGTSSSSGSATYTAGLGFLLSGTMFSADFSVLPGLTVSNTWSNLNDFSLGQLRTQTSAGIPSALTCAGATNVGKLYVRSDAAAANASLYSCDQTGSGVYSWELIQSSGGSSTIQTVQSSSGSAIQSVFVLLGGCNTPSGNNYPGSGIMFNGQWASNCNGIASSNLGYIPNAQTNANSDNFTFWTVLPTNVTAMNVVLTGQLYTVLGGTSTWSAQAACLAAGSATGTTNWIGSPVSGSNNAGSVAYMNYLWTMNNVPITGCSANQVIGINMTRSGSYTSQTLLTGMRIDFTRTLP